MNLSELAVVAAVFLSIANSAAIVRLVRVANAPIVPPQGLPIGSTVPTFEIETLAGSRNTERDTAGRMILFLGATCPPCFSVARELGRTKASVVDRLWVLVVGEVPAQGDNLFDVLGFMSKDQVAHDPTRHVAEQLGIDATPFAYAVDRAGRIKDKTIVPSVAHLQDLERRVRWI